MNIEYSKTLSGVPDINAIIGENNIKYLEFKRQLKIDPTLIFINLAIPALMISVYFISFYYLLNKYSYTPYYFVILGAIWISFWKHSYLTHFHEAAHFNLCKNKDLNDLFSNIFLTPFTGMWVKDYRVTHWKHHRLLGELGDTEISYHKSLNFTEMIQSVTGIYLIRSLKKYVDNFNPDSQGGRGPMRNVSFCWSLSLMLIAQCVIALLLYEFLSIYASIAWIISVFIFDPLMIKIRQTLEHRSYDADNLVD